MRSGGAQRRAAAHAGVRLLACAFFIVAASAQAAPTPRSAGPLTASRTSRRTTTGPRLWLRLRLRAGQHLRRWRTLRDGAGERSRFFGPDGSYAQPRQRRDPQQPQLGLLLPARDRPGVVEKLLAEPPPRGPGPRCARPCAATSRATTATWRTRASTTCLTRAAAARTGCADHGDRRLPALLPARHAREPGRRDRRHRAGAAARPAGDTGRGAPAAAPTSLELGDGLPLEHRLERLRPRPRGRPATGAAWCSATRTSPGTAPSASTRRSSRSPARSTLRARACSACRWC